MGGGHFVMTTTVVEIKKKSFKLEIVIIKGVF